MIDLSHLDTSVGALIRSGVGIFSMVLGAFVLAARPRLPPNVILGTFFVLDGVAYAVYALAGGFSEFPHKELVVPSHVATTVLQFTLAGLVLAYAAPLLRQARAGPWVNAAAVVALVFAFLFNPLLFFVLDTRPPVELYGSQAGLIAGLWDYTSYGAYLGSQAFACVALLASIRRDPDQPAARARLLLAAAWMANLTTALGALLVTAATVPEFKPVSQAAAFVEGALFVAVVLGALRLRRVGPWGAWWPVVVVFWALGAGLGEMVATGVSAGNDSDSGFGGLVSLVGTAAVAYAIFRLDLLGVPVPRPRAGVLASIALATLFITAQVAQNFLSDELGLLTGGIVAGAAVFAAYPLQKAAEKAMEKRTSRPEDPRPSTGEAAYRTALGLALRDRRLSPKEELELARLADQLGVGAVRALEIRAEVDGRRQRGA